MKGQQRYITLFEHESLIVGQHYDSVEFSEHYFNALQLYHVSTKGLFYELGYKKVTFLEYVGVIKVGNLTIEILPKADNPKYANLDKDEWKSRLIDMLKAVRKFEIHAPSSSVLKLKSNSLLELYFEIFISEIEYLLHQGLVKKYRRIEGNSYALKGSLKFNKHIQQNLVHQERSYVSYTTYDVQHLLHFILYKAIKVLDLINSLSSLKSRIGALMLHFPEMPDMKVTEETFEKLTLNRKTLHYQRAIEIARMIMLNYHPDITKGGNHVLALLFDMNLLWEQFVLVSLRRGYRQIGSSAQVLGQQSKDFWRPQTGTKSKLRPDILIKQENGSCFVLDTKWKNIVGRSPSPEDLRQMYVYHRYFKANKVALVYPGDFDTIKGFYLNTEGNDSDLECSLISLKPEGNIKEWQENIFSHIQNWTMEAASNNSLSVHQNVFSDEN